LLLRHVDKFFHLVLIAYTKQTSKITKFLNYQDDHSKTSKKLTQSFHLFYLNQIILHNQDLHPWVRLTKHTEDNSKSTIHSIIEFWHIPWYFLWYKEHSQDEHYKSRKRSYTTSYYLTPELRPYRVVSYTTSFAIVFAQVSR
jgi:hypothetical protein